MGSEKYVGLDVHKDTISIAVMNSAGKLIMESIIETKACTATCMSPLKKEPGPRGCTTC
jgi:hypothetical protein